MTGDKCLKELVEIVKNDGIITDIVTISVADRSNIADYLLIGTAFNPSEAQGVSELIQDVMQEKGYVLKGKDGENEGRWIVLDYSTVIVHIMVAASRQFYALEKLWSNEDGSNVTYIQQD